MKFNEGLSLSPSKCIGLKSHSYLKNRSASSATGLLATITDEKETKNQKSQISSYFANSTSPSISTSSQKKSDNRLLTYADIKEDTKNFMGNQSNGVNLSTVKTIQFQSTHIKYNPNSNSNGIEYKAKAKTKKINLFITPINSIRTQSKIPQILTDSNNNSIRNSQQIIYKYNDTIENKEIQKQGSTIETEQLKINEITAISVNSNSNINNHIISPKGKIRRYASMDSLTKIINTNNKAKQTKADLIDIEDLMPLEEKHLDIMSSILNSKSCKRECFSWWKYYFNSTLKGGKYEEYFTDNTAKIIIHTANNLELFSVMFCYYISEDISEIKKYNQLINSIFTNLHLNSLLISRFIMTHTGNSNCITSKNVWFDQMNVYLRKQLADDKENKEKDIVAKVKANCTLIVEAIRKILSNYRKNMEYDHLKYYFNNLTQVTNENLNDFFVNTIINRTNLSSSGNINKSNCNQPNTIIEINRQDKDKKITPKPLAPYLPTKRLKPYTLVLDLDETLINTKVASSTKGIVIFRPGLNDFLIAVKVYYELVLFTAATQDYAESILQMIEANEKIFDYKLFNYHTVQCGKTKIKDLSLLGRDLSSIIIVDNVALCFKLQKENGILIKSFYGDADNNESDIVLTNLMPILIKIAKDKGDVRQSIVKYKAEILSKISPTAIIDGKKNV